MTITITQATAAYSDAGFWTKARDFTLRAGYEVIEKALWLFYAQQKPEMPLEVKAVIRGALGYFLLPLDLIPDALPVAGFSDDLTALAAALAIAACYIDAEVKAKAGAKLRDWFGNAARAPAKASRRPRVIEG
jgi:uncharacterized membrane protein YkvA (DUF1232 family)